MSKIIEISGTASGEECGAVLKKLEKSEVRAEERAQKALKIGMSSLAEQDRNAVSIKKAIAWCEIKEIFPISQADQEVWEEWLPTGYVNGDSVTLDSITGGRSWKYYDYHEGIPMSIRDLIIEVSPFFSFLEIRTPERQPIQVMDPVLFGHIQYPNGNHDVLLLARWSESDANFVSLDDIKHIIKARTSIFPKSWEANTWGAGETFVLMVMAALSFLVLGFLPAVVLKELGLRSYIIPMFIFLASLSSVIVVADRLVARWRKKKLRKTHPHLSDMV